MKIKEIIEKGRNILIKNNVEDSFIIVRQLLCKTLNVDKQYLVINDNEDVEKEKYELFNNYIEQIIKGMPLQYITNKQEFMGIEFYVNKNVLIPQPDTEILVENVLKICENIKETKEINKEECKEKVKILDLCTGSGAIAISLDSILEGKNINANIYASDISNEALEVAMKNNNLNNTNIKFINSNLFENIKEKNFDIIVSNPPYIRTDVIENELSKQVKEEPIIALDGGIDGLDFYRKIISKAKTFLNNSGYLCLEIGYDQKKEVIDLLKENKEYTEIKVIKDLSNNDRCIIAKMKL